MKYTSKYSAGHGIYGFYGLSVKKYTYDKQNQLTREDNQAAGKTWVWTYDDAGNILTRKEYAYTTGTLGTATDTVNYTYGNSNWGDLLTAYDGHAITHDGIGNALSDGTWIYTWEHGRELMTMSGGGTTWTYTYDANGMRTKRTNGSTTYSYIYNGSSLSQMTVGSNTLNFAYDASGTPMAVTYNGTNYYYVTNLQGDVVALLNSSGSTVVTYTYDACGNILTTSGSMASTLGAHNPLRYRGYVYDQETNLYYLQSRYYDPQVGRFINADSYSSTGQGVIGNNMFAYCGNNPTNRLDPSGNEYTVVGAGIQFELNIGGTTVGVEVIVYWDVDECEGKGLQVAVYCYGGISLNTDDPLLASIMAAIMDNVDMFVDANDVEIMATAMMLSDDLSVSISGVLIMGNENFTSTESYTEDFTSVGAGCGIVKGGFAYSDSCMALSLGRKYDTAFSLIPSLSVSDTYYIQILEFNIMDCYKGICKL